MEVNEWLDEVLPPMEVDFENDFDEGDDGEEDGPIALTMTMEDGSLLGNYTEEWFASSRKPRRFRPSKVSHNCNCKCRCSYTVYCQTYSSVLNHTVNYSLCRSADEIKCYKKFMQLLVGHSDRRQCGVQHRSRSPLRHNRMG